MCFKWLGEENSFCSKQTRAKTSSCLSKTQRNMAGIVLISKYSKYVLLIILVNVQVLISFERWKGIIITNASKNLETSIDVNLTKCG